MEDSIEKRKYIYKVIPDIFKNHEVIINFLKINNIPQTENANGIFVNLAVLSDDIIHKLYELIGQILYYKTDETYNDYNIQYQDISSSTSSKPLQKEYNYKKIQIRKVLNKDIIMLSKMYKIE